MRQTGYTITPELIERYKLSLKGMKKTKRKLKQRVSRNRESESAPQNEYRIELINAIEGLMKAVVNSSDKRVRIGRHKKRLKR